MKVLMISFDRRVFVEGSEVSSRMIDLGTLAQELYIIVYSTRSHELSLKKLSSSVTLHPTNSRSKWLYSRDAKRIMRMLKHNGRVFDLVTAQSPFEEGLSALAAKRIFKARLQVQVHTDFLNRTFLFASLFNMGRVFLSYLTLSRADCIRVVSKRIRESILRHPFYTAPIDVLPVYVDVDKIKNRVLAFNVREKYPTFKKIILMVARLEREKRIDVALRALPAVQKAVEGVGLVIVGHGRELHALKALVKKLKIEASVVFEGWSDNLSSYYQGSDLFLVTSAYEGFGRTLLEARLLGLPAVSTDVGIAREAGAIIANENTLASSIIEALKSPPSLKPLPVSFILSKEEYLSKYKELWECC